MLCKSAPVLRCADGHTNAPVLPALPVLPSWTPLITDVCKIQICKNSLFDSNGIISKQLAINTNLSVVSMVSMVSMAMDDGSTYNALLAMLVTSEQSWRSVATRVRPDITRFNDRSVSDIDSHSVDSAMHWDFFVGESDVKYPDQSEGRLRLSASVCDSTIKGGTTEKDSSLARVWPPM